MIPLLRIRNLHKTFNNNTVNQVTLFKSLSLDIEENDFVTIIGSNGAGKSTLLNIISGMISIDDGTIVLNDKDISKMTEFKRTRFIGRVFQDPSLGTSPSMTILENLSMAYNKGRSFGLSHGVSNKNIPLFKELLSQLSLGLEDKLDTNVGMLSGGQRQSLALIMATLSTPKLLLLDEHTAALDPKTSETIIKITKDIVKDKKISTLMVTHNLNHAIDIGNRLIMLHRGAVVLDIRDREKDNLTIDKLLKLFNNINPSDSLSDRLLFS
ncbi:ABC transporter ATP-binding protein [Clostridiisalibacter paucivorans]|uniref:ABC transporter ATP-binding protein n=1 Tax=Clostridiisalibacter paucivorans TaxID=408753 RepID=UPI000A9A6743